MILFAFAFYFCFCLLFCLGEKKGGKRRTATTSWAKVVSGNMIALFFLYYIIVINCCKLHLPSSKSLMSFAAWMPSSFRFFSICLERCMAARSSADVVQPILLDFVAFSLYYLLISWFCVVSSFLLFWLWQHLSVKLRGFLLIGWTASAQLLFYFSLFIFFVLFTKCLKLQIYTLQTEVLFIYYICVWIR